MPKVSVIIPTYNRDCLVTRAIDSVQQQTFKNWELIVVDDASEDRTKDIVNSYEDPRVKIMCHSKNQGGAKSRNTGIKESKGYYVAFLDSDDAWLPEKLEVQLEAIKKARNNVGVLYCNNYIKKEGTEGVRVQNRSKLKKGDLHKDLLSGWCPSITSSVLIPKKVFKDCGYFDTELPSYQDYDLWIRISKRYHFEYVERPLVIRYKNVSGQITSCLKDRKKGFKMFLDKWECDIQKYTGKERLKKIKKDNITNMYRSALKSDIKNGKFYLKKLYEIDGIRFKDIILFIVNKLGIYSKIRKYKHTFRSLFYESKNKRAYDINRICNEES